MLYFLTKTFIVNYFLTNETIGCSPIAQHLGYAISTCIAPIICRKISKFCTGQLHVFCHL